MIPPYSFYPALRGCPHCGGALATTQPVNLRTMAGPAEKLGLSCFCSRCSQRYRATARIRFGWISWLGPAGRWLWWQAARLEITTPSME